MEKYVLMYVFLNEHQNKEKVKADMPEENCPMTMCNKIIFLKKAIKEMTSKFLSGSKI